MAVCDLRYVFLGRVDGLRNIRSVVVIGTPLSTPPQTQSIVASYIGFKTSDLLTKDIKLVEQTMSTKL